MTVPTTPASLANSLVCCFVAAGIADKPGSEEPHYHMQQEERVVVKQGKLGYFIGHQHHVQSAEPGDKEVVVKPGGLQTAFGPLCAADELHLQLPVVRTACCNNQADCVGHGCVLFESEVSAATQTAGAQPAASPTHMQRMIRLVLRTW